MEDSLLCIFHDLGKSRTINVLYSALGFMQSFNGQPEASAIARGMYACLTAKEKKELVKSMKNIIGVPDAPKKRKRKRIPVSYK
jgi:hypothetical protein